MSCHGNHYRVLLTNLLTDLDPIFLKKYLGPSVFYGIAVLLVAIPLNSFTLRILNRLSRLENEAKDARTKRTSESIANMKLLKLQGWEQQFADQIREHRRDELKRHATKGVVRALNQAISNSVPALVLVVTLTAYVKTGMYTALLYSYLGPAIFFFGIAVLLVVIPLNSFTLRILNRTTHCGKYYLYGHFIIQSTPLSTFLLSHAD